MSEWDNEVYAKAIGQRVASVRAADARSDHYAPPVILTFDSGTALKLELDADCCSRSYFTDTKQFDELVGSTIQKIEERDGECADDPEGDTVRWHFLVFETDKGHVTIDWRNDSNGYYDGSVDPEWIAP